MAEPSVLLNIGDMIDLAIGTPEMGVVDFNMLQTVLHCLAQQLRVQSKNVELRGSVANLPVGKEHVQTIAITEFVVDTQVDDKATDAKPKKASVSDEPETILVVERVKKTDVPTTEVVTTVPPGDPDHKVEKKTVIERTIERTIERKVRQPGVTVSADRLSLVTMSKFNMLEMTVDDLKNKVYGTIPTNEEILGEVRSQTNLKAITDMWTSMNVSSRLEAAETGIAKLSSLVQDMIGETTGLQDAIKKQGSQAEISQAAGAGAGAGGGAGAGTLASNVQNLSSDLKQLADLFYKAMQALNVPIDSIAGTEDAGGAVGIGGAGAGIGGAGSGGAGTGGAGAGAPGVGGTEGIDGRPAFAGPSVTELTQRLNALEKRMKECCESIGKVEGGVQDQLNSFQDQLDQLLKQVGSMTQDLMGGKISPDLVKDLQGLMQLFETVQDMKEQLKQVHETALQLAAEKEDRQQHINALLEQIELLKIIKLDREDMVEAMAEKADLRMLARKVSHDQFEMACDDLSRGVEHALGKLNVQEALWQQALDDIQREIETKLDKMELSPVKDFFNNKLKQLQENLKQMASLRKEAEAAGTKRKLMRDLNCISCDAKAVMAMEAPPSLPQAKPMPANLSMKPYLSYELDAIRKAQASNMPQRNMHDWENIDKQMTQPKPPQKVRSETDKHLCNRYCGGSHTVTTPAQRVARLGHFVKQWGPDVLPLSSGLAAGDDGRMYKVNATEGVAAGPMAGGAGGEVPMSKSPMPRKSESHSKQPPKPIQISAECRCLDCDHPVKN